MRDRFFWIVLLAGSLAAGSANLAVATLPGPRMHEEPAALLAFLAVGVAAAAIAQLAIWLVAAPLLLRAGLEARALCVAIAVGIVAVAIAWPIVDSVEGVSSSVSRSVIRASIWFAAALAAHLAYLLAADASARLQALGAALTLAAPVLGVCTLRFVWVQMFRIEGVASQDSLISIALFAIALLATAAVAYALRERVPPLGWLISATSLALAAPIVWLLVSSDRAAARGRPADAAHTPVLLITVDTLRADALDLDGADGTATPALAALASESLVFEQARSAGPWTKVGVASILTGLSPLVHGTTRRQSRLPDELFTLAEYLGARGYQTGAIGNSPILHENGNFDQGFEDYVFFPRSPGTSLGGRLLAAVSPARFGSSSPSNADLTEMASDWIHARHDQPFFLWLHYFDPHLPYAPDPGSISGESPAPRIGWSFSDSGGVRAGSFHLVGAEKAWIRTLYETEVRDVDANLARLVSTLRERGLYDRMLIALTSDHGEEFWEHGGFEHGHSLYDEVLRVPLILKLPGQEFARRITVPVSTESLTPTVLEVLDLPVEGDPFTARSLAEFASPSASPPTEVPIVCTGVLYFDEKTSVLFDGMKYIRSGDGREELYDMTEDPGERTPLTHSSPERLQQARAILDRHASDAARMRDSLELPEESVFTPDAEWLENLRSLGYIQ